MDEKGVSPVIGVILMVAATIVIAAVVMGMLGSFSPPKKTYSVAVSASKTSQGKVTLTFIGGPETIKLGSFVGATMTSNNTYDQGAHVVVYAKFKDSTEQVVLETYV